jgi:hypothetical protein
MHWYQPNACIWSKTSKHRFPKIFVIPPFLGCDFNIRTVSLLFSLCSTLKVMTAGMKLSADVVCFLLSLLHLMFVLIDGVC